MMLLLTVMNILSIFLLFGLGRVELRDGGNRRWPAWRQGSWDVFTACAGSEFAGEFTLTLRANLGASQLL